MRAGQVNAQRRCDSPTPQLLTVSIRIENRFASLPTVPQTRTQPVPISATDCLIQRLLSMLKGKTATFRIFTLRLPR
jgi:hypothetical protein